MAIDQDEPIAYLIEADAYDQGNPVTVYGSCGRTSTIVNNKHYPAIVKSIDIEQRIATDELEGEQGSSAFGSVDLAVGGADISQWAWGDGELLLWGDSEEITWGVNDYDNLGTYIWAGHDIKILAGHPDDIYSNYDEIFNGIISNANFSNRSFALQYKSDSWVSYQETPNHYYNGTGGLLGGADLKDVNKPMAWGYCYNVTPILVDKSRLIYQPAYRVSDVTALYEGGYDSSYIFDGYVTDIEATTPASGHYTVCLLQSGTGGGAGQSFIRLGSEPVYPITCDIEGQRNFGGSFVVRADSIARDILVPNASSTSSLDIDSFNQVATQNAAPLGYYLTEPKTKAEAVEDVLSSIGATWYVDSDGLVGIRVIEFTTPVSEITHTDIVFDSLRRDVTPPPHSRTVIGYRRNWTLMNETDMHPSASADQVTFSRNEYRYEVKRSTSTVVAPFPTAQAHILPTFISGPLDSGYALSEAVRRFDQSYGSEAYKPDVVTITLFRHKFLYRHGDTVYLRYPRYNLNKAMIILSIRENSSRGTTTLRLFG